MEPIKLIRIGKDISLRWSILTDGAAIPLQGRDLTLEMKSPIGKVIILPYRVDGNVITITYYGYEQTVVGEYSLTTIMECMFDGCTSLNSLILGPNFFKTSAVTIIDFSFCGKWKNETVITSLVTNSYDRAAAGLNTLTLKLHANTKAALTDEQKATITSKGYTIA